MREFRAFFLFFLISGVLFMSIWLGACGTDNPLLVPEPTTPTWERIVPAPFAGDINAVWGFSPNHLFAVGEEGLLLVREGDRWQQASIPTTEDLLSIHGCDRKCIYAVDRKGLLRLEDQHWSRVEAIPESRDGRVFCSSPDDVMYLAREGTAYHFDGDHWTISDSGTSGTSADTYQWLAGDGQGQYVAVDSGGRIAVYQHGAWEIDATFESYALAAVVHEDIGGIASHYAIAGYGSGRAVLIDGYPGSWSVRHGVDGYRVVSLAQSQPAGAVFMLLRASGDPMVLFEGIHGITREFETSRSGALASFLECNQDGLYENTLVVGGQDGLLCTRDSAGLWTTQGAGLNGRCFGIQGWANGDFSAVSPDYDHLRRRDGVTDIEQLDYINKIRAIWGPYPDLVFGLTINGDMTRMLAGQPVEEIQTPSAYLDLIWGTSSENIYVASSYSAYRFNGTSWDSIGIDVSSTIIDIVGRSDTDVVIATNTELFMGADDEWTRVQGPEDCYLTAVALEPDGSGVYAAVELDDYDMSYGSEIWYWADGAWRRLDGQGGWFLKDLIARPGGELWAATSYRLYRIDPSGVWSEVFFRGDPELDHRVWGMAMIGDSELLISAAPGAIYTCNLSRQGYE